MWALRVLRCVPTFAWNPPCTDYDLDNTIEENMKKSPHIQKFLWFCETMCIWKRLWSNNVLLLYDSKYVCMIRGYHAGESNVPRWTLIGLHGVRHNPLLLTCCDDCKWFVFAIFFFNWVSQSYIPIGSMYGILSWFIYIYYTNQLNVCRYTKHYHTLILWDSIVTRGVRLQNDRSFLAYRNHKMLSLGSWEAEFGT